MTSPSYRTNTWKIVRELQPDACIFSDVGPDLRWVGNEDGAAGDPCWATLDHSKITPGSADAGVLNSGTRGGPAWIPAEADFPLRIHPKGWFWHPAAKPATAAELIAIRLRITRAAACPALAGIEVYLEPEAGRGHLGVLSLEYNDLTTENAKKFRLSVHLFLSVAF